MKRFGLSVVAFLVWFVREWRTNQVGAVTVTSDQSWRIMPKESVKYPVIPKQKEYYIVQQGLSVDTPAMSGLVKTGTAFFLPDKGTLVGLMLQVDHNSEVGNECYGVTRLNAKLNGDTLATINIAERMDSTVGQAVFANKWGYIGGLWMPVNDDDDVSIQITCDHSNASGLIYMGATAFWYIIKED